MRKISGHGTAFVVKLRGLPYAVTEQQIEEFFSGKFPDPNPLSILICTRYQEKRQWLTACIICSHRWDMAYGPLSSTPFIYQLHMRFNVHTYCRAKKCRPLHLCNGFGGPRGSFQSQRLRVDAVTSACPINHSFVGHITQFTWLYGRSLLTTFNWATHVYELQDLSFVIHCGPGNSIATVASCLLIIVWLKGTVYLCKRC